MKFKLTQDGLVEVPPTPLDLLGAVPEGLSDAFKENIKENTKDFMWAVLEALRDILVDTIGAIALVGGGLCIIFRVVGWDGGYKWAGILFTANVFVKYLLGGL